MDISDYSYANQNIKEQVERNKKITCIAYGEKRRKKTRVYNFGPLVCAERDKGNVVFSMKFYPANPAILGKKMFKEQQ